MELTLATLTALAQANMFDSSTYTKISGATSTFFSISNSSETIVFNGQFYYPNGNTSDPQGTLNGWQYYKYGQLQGTITDINTDFGRLISLSKAGQPMSINQIVFDGGDSFYGSNFSDTFISFGPDSTFIGKGGNDTITAWSSGLNISVYSGSANQYSISGGGKIFTIIDSIQSRDGSDTLTNISQAKFSDYTLVFDKTAPIDTTVYQLYQAAFARTPDNGGFRFWTEAAEKQGLSPLQLANNFSSSHEFLQKFGQNPTNLDYVTKLYTNVLGRAPDKGGLDYWTHQADAGRSHEQLLVDFATSQENVQLTGIHTANHVYWTS